jgi:hypothetical protein
VALDRQIRSRCLDPGGHLRSRNEAEEAKAGVDKSCSSQVQQPERPCRPAPTAITFTGSAKTLSARVATVYGLDDHIAARPLPAALAGLGASVQVLAVD